MEGRGKKPRSGWLGLQTRDLQEVGVPGSSKGTPHPSSLPHPQRPGAKPIPALQTRSWPSRRSEVCALSGTPPSPLPLGPGQGRQESSPSPERPSGPDTNTCGPPGHSQVPAQAPHSEPPGNFEGPPQMPAEPVFQTFEERPACSRPTNGMWRRQGSAEGGRPKESNLTAGLCGQMSSARSRQEKL